MNPPESASYSYEPFSCYCLHNSAEHVLMRCGHPNDRPSGHPLHTADDALHRVWCKECGKWCFSKRNDCPVFQNPSIKLGEEGKYNGCDNTLNSGSRNTNPCARM